MAKVSDSGVGAWFDVLCGKEGHPAFFTVYDWIAQFIAPHLAWDLEVSFFSESQSPVAAICGRVHARRFDVAPRRIWCADWETRRRRVRRQRAQNDDNHGRADEDQSLQGDQEASVFDDLDAQEDEAQGSDESESGSGEEDLLQALVEGAVVEDEHETEVEDPGARDGHPQDISLARARRLAPSSSSSSSSSGSSSSSSEDRDESREGIVRTVQEDTHSWGPFRLTWRAATRTQRSAWQATCKHHADYQGTAVRTRCTRSMAASGPATEDGQRALRVLKAWLLGGGKLRV